MLSSPAAGTSDGIDRGEKTRENRLRASAERQGYRLRKTRRRDPRAIDYGTWAILEPFSNSIVGERMTLDAVEAWLATDPEHR